MDQSASGDTPNFRLLGTPSYALNGQIVANFRSNRIPALIGLLATSKKPWSRDVVASILWPDSMPTDGRHSLRQTILFTKQLLGEGIFVLGRQTLELSPDFQTDVNLLLQANNAFRSPDEVIPRLELAVGAYQGDFLDGFEDDWIPPIRAFCAKVYVDSLLSLADHYLSIEPRRSLKYALQAIATEPYLDGARVRKIQALQALGEEASAHQEFRSYRELLTREFGIEPAPIFSESIGKNDGNQENQEQKVEANSTVDKANEDAINFLLRSSRPKNGLKLAIAHIPFWVSKGQARTGVEVMRRSLSILDPLDSSPDAQIGLIGLCELLAADSKVYEARETLAGLLPTIQDDYVRLRALLVYARVFIVAYQPHEATPHTKEALRLSLRCGTKGDRIDALRAAADTAFLSENPTEAELLADEATGLALEVGDWQSFASLWIIIATIRLRTGRKEEAKLAMETALDEITDKENPAISNIRVRFYRLIEELGDLTQAERGYRVGVKETRSYDDQMGLSIALTYLGDILTVRGKFEEALRVHEEALAIRLVIKEPLGEATSQRGIGRIHLACGRLDEADLALKESSRLFTACNSVPGHSSALLELAKVAKERKNYGLALRIALRTKHLLTSISRLAQMTNGPTGDAAVVETEMLIKSLS